jgi:hypothetical protein
MPDHAEPEGYGGIWDDVQTGLKWKPILPMLQALESSKGTVDKMRALRNVAAFAIKTGLKVDPYSRRGFLIFSKYVDLCDRDPEWLAITEDILK